MENNGQKSWPEKIANTEVTYLGGCHERVGQYCRYHGSIIRKKKNWIENVTCNDRKWPSEGSNVGKNVW